MIGAINATPSSDTKPIEKIGEKDLRGAYDILTDDQPSNVCGNSAVAAIETQIKAQTKVA